MSTRLRSIALTVDESGDGDFVWVLLEASGRCGVYDLPVDRGVNRWRSYSEALREGAAALMQLSLKSPKGPRTQMLKILKRA